MTDRIPPSRRLSDETGAVLLLALGFVAFVGLVTVVLLNYTETSARATSALRPVRSAQFAADGSVEGAINKMRQFRADSTAPCVGGFYSVSPALNGQGITLDCSGLTVVSSSTPSMDVTFTAKCPVAGSTGCPSGVTMITAVVRFAGTPPSVSTTVRSWSVRR
jgi:hypothetical protein